MIADSHSFLENHEGGYLGAKRLFQEHQTFLSQNPPTPQLLKNQSVAFAGLLLCARKANVSNAVMIDLLTQGIGANRQLHELDSRANDRSVILSHHYSDLGKAQYVAHHYVLADKSFAESLSWRKKIPGGDSSEQFRDSWILTTHNNFANSLLAQGKCRRAKVVMDSGVAQLNSAWFEKPPKGLELLMVARSWLIRSKIETELWDYTSAKLSLLRAHGYSVLKEYLPQQALLSSLAGDFFESKTLVLRMLARKMFDPVSVFVAFQSMAGATEISVSDPQLRGQCRLIAVCLLKQMLVQNTILTPMKNRFWKQQVLRHGYATIRNYCIFPKFW